MLTKKGQGGATPIPYARGLIIINLLALAFFVPLAIKVHGFKGGGGLGAVPYALMIGPVILITAIVNLYGILASLVIFASRRRYWTATILLVASLPPLVAMAIWFSG